jgi:hypothetical protein
MRGELTRSNSVLVCVRFRIHRYEGAPFTMAIKAENKYHAERLANFIITLHLPSAFQTKYLPYVRQDP